MDATAGRPSNSLHFKVGEMSGKLDQILITLLPQLTDHDTRIGALEAKFNWFAGGGAVVVFLITSWEVVKVILHIH